MGQLYGVPRRDRGTAGRRVAASVPPVGKARDALCQTLAGHEARADRRRALVHRPRLLFPDEPTTKDLLRDLAQLRESASAQAPDADGG
jgi:ABC-type ATPase involved in cell division